MNPTSLYRDPALDDLVTQRNGPVLNSSTGKPSRHSRHASMATREPLPPSALPPAHEAAKGPTIVYPGNDPVGRSGGVQRSFSQRARGRPFADEAFADDYLGDSVGDGPEHRQHSQRTAPQPQQQTGPLRDSRDGPNDNRRQAPIQDNIHSAATAARPPRDQLTANSAAQDRPHRVERIENDAPGLARAPTLKDATNQAEQQRDWAPDRSPLQKLEVTLNDISKEEKRARVQEAEMLHRERTRAHRPTGRSGESGGDASRQSQPATIEDVGMVRSLSNTHKDRLQRSTVIESRKPDARRLSGDRQGFEYQSAALPYRSVTITRRGQRHSSQPTSSTQQATASSYSQPPPEPSAAAAQQRSISATQPPSRLVAEPTLTSSISQRTRHRQGYDADRLPTAAERNASHRAALQRLEGPAPTTQGRTARRDLQDGYDTTAQAAPQPPTAGKAQNFAHMQSNPRTSTPQGQTLPAGLAMQGSPGLRSIDSPAPADKPNPVQGQKRHSSVSFKEPFDRPRPIDEWKLAETARLDAEHFLQEPKHDSGQNKAWWEQDTKSRRRSFRGQAAAALENPTIDDRTAEFKPHLWLRCGPLLRYTGMKRTVGEGAKEYWRGTIMIVTQDSKSSCEKAPILRLFAQPKSLYSRPPPTQAAGEAESHIEQFDPLAGCIKVSRRGHALYVRPAENLEPLKDLSKIETDDGLFENTPPITSTQGQAVSVAPVAPRMSDRNGETYGRHTEVKGVRLYADPDRDVTFWLFKVEVQLGPEQQHVGYRINGGAASGFWVPAEGQTMNIMFHSCNGFSLSVKPDDFSGPDPLWRDVLNAHQSRPFHVMIGGGDQIYNDKIMNQTRHFGDWTANKNPHYKHHAPFTTEMKEELESCYLENYCTWFSQGLFSMAASQIPMVNMWDDHDIIDGFGSYPHAFQLSPVFSGIGNVAFKYYMLFQHHSVDAMTSADEPSWVLGYKPGPYIRQLSRSIFLDLGRPVAFLALDCRTERMKNQVLSVDTCDVALERCRKEIVEGQTKHLIVLLGIPIAYPRMNWLENVLTSRAMDPVKALGRYGVLKGGFLNRFDGGVEVLDDLDDHWTAHHHKEERNEFIKELQDLAAERSVRVTILGGDVHLGAIGQFYSNPKLKIPKDRDHRYMPNVISSAIVNTPPPEMLADVLNKRNKVHHLDSYTDESMIPMFTHDVNGKKRNNKHLLPRRNWCSITQYVPGKTPTSSRSASPARSESLLEAEDGLAQPKRRFSLSKEDVNPRTLFRRLSSRNAPPSAYDNPYKASRPLDPRVDGDGALAPGQRAASFDDVRADRSQPRSWNDRLGLTRRTASETREPVIHGADERNDTLDSRKPPPFRPGFHRRPTNLSEKAARKGNMPAIDAEGNEFDVNDHVNLDGGLDIVLNFEIDRSDPRGATEPYRLLVPGLWYDGSSDREKLDGAGGLHRKPTLMNRLGFGGKRGHKAAQSQGAGNWGQEMSETESYTGSEDEEGGQPKKKFGIFGSLRKKRPQHPEEGERDIKDHYGAGAGVAAPDAEHVQTPGAPPSSYHDRVTDQGTTTPKDTPPRMGHQAGPGDYDMPYDMSSVPRQPFQASFNSPPGQDRQIPGTREQTGKGNVLRKNSLKKQDAARGPQEVTVVSPTITTTTEVRHKPAPQSQARVQYPEPMSPTEDRRNSYTIRSARPSGPQGRGARVPFDADSAYVSHGQQRSDRAALDPVASSPTFGPPSSYPNQTAETTGMQRSSSLRSAGQSSAYSQPSRQQEQVIGNAPERDAFSGNPQPRALRGNGILGRLGISSGRSASANQVGSDHVQGQNPHSVQSTQPHAGQAEFGAPQRTMSQGYSGIEAYTEKPKRGLSLRDRARNLLERVEGKRRYNDEDDYSYDSEGSFSDELGEEPQGPDHGKGRVHPEAGYSDGEGSFIEDDNGKASVPKRGLSQKFRLGMMRMGSKRGPSTEKDPYEKSEAKYH